MKLNKNTLLILAVYCIPFVFLSMYDDLKNYSMIVYGLSVIVICYCAYLAKRKSSFIVLLAANTLSFFSSYFWIKSVAEIQEKGYYFSPLTPVQLLVAVTILFFLLQVGVYCFTKSHGNKKHAEQIQ